MRHVDDGTMHAWLDQQVSDPVDVAWIGAHLRECAACRARLEEERASLQQAEGLLASVAPAADTSPSAFAALVERAERIPSSRATTVRFHTWVLAAGWAASVAMAVALGWVGRDLWSERDSNGPDSRIAALTEDERRGASSTAATSSAQRAAEAASPAPAREVAAPAVPPPSPSTAKRAALASSAPPEQPRSDRLEARESKAETERASTAPAFRGGVDSLSAADAVQSDAARLRQGQGQGQGKGQAGAAAQPEAAARKAAEPAGGGGAVPQPPAPATRPPNSQETTFTLSGALADAPVTAPAPPPAAVAPPPQPVAVASAPPPGVAGGAAPGGAGGGRGGGGGGGGGGGRGGRGAGRATADGLTVAGQPGTPAASSLLVGWQALSRTDAAARSGMALYGINGLTPMTTLLSPDGRAVRTFYRLDSGEVVELTQQKATDETNRANDPPPASTAANAGVAGAPTARQQPATPATVWSQIRGDVRVTLRGATDPDSLTQQLKLD